jgi:hypothetical protein
MMMKLFVSDLQRLTAHAVSVRQSLFDNRTAVRLSTFFPRAGAESMWRPRIKHHLKDRKPAARKPARVESATVKDEEFMLTLTKRLAVLSSFGRNRRAMTLSEAAQVVDLSRATTRRVPHTLVELGDVEQNGRQFALTPRIMRLGFVYISSQSWVVPHHSPDHPRRGSLVPAACSGRSDATPPRNHLF